MNLQQLPDEIKKDVEDSSLDILALIKKDITVIGGWASRVLLGPDHIRYTLDVDGFTEKGRLKNVHKKLKRHGFKKKKADWGMEFIGPYEPMDMILQKITLNNEQQKALEQLVIRIDISGPRMNEKFTHHFFEFDPSENTKGRIHYRLRDDAFEVTVPKLEWMAANKLGLPADYKNVFDSCLFLLKGDLKRIAQIILMVDDWADLVKRRIKRNKSRALQKEHVANHLLQTARIDFQELKRRYRILESLLWP